jgi:tight adherence protein C
MNAIIEQYLHIAPDDFYLGLLAIMAFFVIYKTGMSLLNQDHYRGRVQFIKQRAEQLRAEIRSPKRRPDVINQDAIDHQDREWMKVLVTKMKMIQENQVEKIQQNLINAGYRAKDAIYVYAFLQLILPFVFLFLGYFLADIDFDNLEGSGQFKLALPLLAAWIGMKLPGILVLNRKVKRHLVLRRSLPDTLDLMMICAEAGLSLGATLSRVSKELGVAYPEMADELALTSIEMGLLPDRKKALKNFAWRNDLEEIRGIVNVLLQTEKYGTPVSQALRVLSHEFRTQRMLAAEQKAARLPALMTVPMILFILPTLFIVIITPAIIEVFNAL